MWLRSKLPFAVLVALALVLAVGGGAAEARDDNGADRPAFDIGGPCGMDCESPPSPASCDPLAVAAAITACGAAVVAGASIVPTAGASTAGAYWAAGACAVATAQAVNSCTDE